MRGTLHFVSAEDIRWMLSLVSSRLISSAKTRYKQLKLNDKIFEKSNKVLIKILSGGKQLTRNEIADELKLEGIKTTGVQLSHILQRAALEQLICFGVRREKQFTFTLLNEWIKPGRKLDSEEALAEIAKRYFQSRSPATLQDFTWWSGLSAADSRKALELVQSKFTIQNLNSKTYVSYGVNHKHKTSKVYLLPGFDEYLIGYKDRSEILDREHFKKLNAGGGFLSPTIIINGRVAGTWKREFKKNKVLIFIKSFNTFSESELKEISKSAEHYGKFLKMEVEIIKQKY